MEKVVSIIVPIYNAEKFIHRALEHLCGQTYENLEILLINDGSTDNSLALCEQWAQKDARIRIVSQENAGVSAARNHGLEQATGDYVFFADADDWVDKNAIEILVSAAQETGADVATCKLQEENAMAKPEEREVANPEQTVYEGKEAAGLALLNVWAIYCKLFRRDLLEHIRFENYKVAEDVLFNSCVIADTAFERLVAVDAPFYHYVIHESSVMQQKLEGKFLDAMYVEEKCYRKLVPISEKFSDINLMGCAVSRVFEKYAMLSEKEQKKHLADFMEAKQFAKDHKKELTKVSDRRRKISGMLKVYVPDWYVKNLGKRYHG